MTFTLSRCSCLVCILPRVLTDVVREGPAGFWGQLALCPLMVHSFLIHPPTAGTDPQQVRRQVCSRWPRWEGTAVRSGDEAPQARAVAPGPAGQGLWALVRRASACVWFLSRLCSLPQGSSLLSFLDCQGHARGSGTLLRSLIRGRTGTPGRTLALSPAPRGRAEPL